MKFKWSHLALSVLLLMGAMSSYLFYQHKKENEPKIAPASLCVAFWNLENFGRKKSDNVELMTDYHKILINFDIVFLEEIKDVSERAFSKLCAMFPEYYSTSSVFSSNNPEKYGLLVKRNSGINIERFVDHSFNSNSEWERPPIEVTFSANSGTNYTFTIYAIHTKPNNVKRELSNLEEITTNSGNVIIIGDLNASHPYYNPKREPEFNSWYWAIKDNADTTTTSTHAAFDRIIMNIDASRELSSFGIYTDNVQRKHSNHYPVWFQIEIGDR